MVTQTQFSQRITALEESATLGIAKKVRELKAAGRDVVGLTLGEPDFPTPAHIREAAKAALDAGFTQYPPVAGIPELRQAISAKFKRDNGLDYSPDQILVSTGAKQSLYNAILSILNPGDGAILPAPFWVSYHGILYLAQADISILPTTLASGYKITPEQLEAAIQPHTRLFILCTPSNPTGSMYTREELAAIAEVLERHPQVYTIADEIYEYIAFDQPHVSLATFGNLYERVVTVNGFAKGFAMTGWRLGYIGASKPIIELCEKLQGQVTSGATSFSQKGGVAALNGDMSPTWAMRDEFRRRRDLVYASLKQIEGLEVNLPEGAFYFYPDLAAFLGRRAPNGTQIRDIEQLCIYLLDEEGLAVVPGSAFGTDTHVRLSYAYSMEALDDATARMKRALEKLS
ncbi:MAG: pyridoxal phosphate-dependent aminotransferase [Bacteroidia bacterium]|nr:pyridoxal phosphate-dependent aminotransferase [Bacteroidia bacterium]